MLSSLATTTTTTTNTNTTEMPNEETFQKDILRAQSLLESQDWDGASEIYSAILDEQVPIVGQFSPLLGQVYLGYGKALFQMGLKKQDDIINETAMPSSVLEGFLSAQHQENAQQPDGKKRKCIDLDRVTLEEEGGNVPKNSIDKETKDEDSNQEGEDEEEENEDEEEEMDDMELAWDILDLARLVYVDTADKKDSKIALSEIHSILGDISMETENFKQAADDFFNASNYHKDSQIENQRLLASLYYREGIALEYDGRPQESKAPLTSSKDILTSLLNSITTATEEDPDGKDVVGPSSLSDELNTFIKDIENKLIDISNGTSNSAIIGNASLKSSMMAAATNAAQDLTSMIKKRKA